MIEALAVLGGLFSILFGVHMAFRLSDAASGSRYCDPEGDELNFDVLHSKEGEDR